MGEHNGPSRGNPIAALAAFVAILLLICLALCGVALLWTSMGTW